MTAGKIDVLVTYLTMKERPSVPPRPAPRADLALVHEQDIDLARYRMLYRMVGEPWLWWERLATSDEALTEILNGPETSVHVLRVGAGPAGFSELMRLTSGEVEVKFFGLAPDYIGAGLGSYMLERTLQLAWDENPSRVIINTCSLDSPSALAFYQRHGFVVTHQESRVIDDPRRIGILPMSAAPHIPLA